MAGTERSEIVEQQRTLASTLEHLEKTTDPHRLMAELDELRAQLEHHFAAAKSIDLLQEVLDRIGPDLLGSLPRLSDQHQTILAQVDDLRAATCSLAEGPLAAIHNSVTALAHGFRETQAVVSQMLEEAVSSAGLPDEVREPRPRYDPNFEVEANDEIGELYAELASLASESEEDALDAVRKERIEFAWNRLRHLQEEEARRFEEEFDASLAMPIDAGSRILAETRALRRELEGLTAADATAADTDRSSP